MENIFLASNRLCQLPLQPKRALLGFFLCVIFLSTLPSYAQVDGFSVNYNNYASGATYGSSQARADLGSSAYWSQSHNSQVHDGNLRIKFPGGVSGTQCGILANSRLSGDRVYSLEYRIKFDKGFQWKKGGKLPGLAGGDGPTGGKSTSGGNGFTMRYMWRENGRLVVYAYYKDKPASERFGENWDCDNTYFEAGEWYTLKQRVTVNTGNNADGRVEVWVNGEKKLDRENVRLMSNGNTVNRVFLDTFMGGPSNDSQWAPDSTQYLRLDDMRCVKGGVDTPPPPPVPEPPVDNCTNVALSSSIHSVSSEQTGNPASNLLDGTSDQETNRWSAQGYPQWVILDLGSEQNVSAIRLHAYQQRAYRYQVYASSTLSEVQNNAASAQVVDRSNNTSTSPTIESFAATEARYVKLEVSGASGYTGDWVSLRELEVFSCDGGTEEPGGPTDDGSITVRARGDCGNETMELHVDGKKVAAWENILTSWTDYTFTGFSGSGQVSVYFTNNDGATGCDRNLAVDYVAVCGTKYETEEVATETATCCTNVPDKLFTNGNFNFGTLSCGTEPPPPTEPTGERISVRAKGWTGGERMLLLINGSVAYAWSQVATAADLYTYDGYRGGTVAIAFDNDGEGGVDRNLGVDYVEVCGVQRQAEQATRDIDCGRNTDGFAVLWCNSSLNFGELACGSNTRASSSAQLGETARLGQPEVTLEPDWTIYPNPIPAGSQLQLKGLAGQTGNIVVYSLSGQVLRTPKLAAGQEHLDLSGLPNGTYYLRIDTPQGSQTRTFIIR